MNRGDIIINPWVRRDIDGALNPLYATIYLGNNCSLDYRGRKRTWADKVYKENSDKKTPWRVIGHVDIDRWLKEQISIAVNQDDEEDDE